MNLIKYFKNTLRINWVFLIDHCQLQLILSLFRKLLVKLKTHLTLLLATLAVTLTATLLVFSNKMLCSFFVRELGYPDLIFIHAIIWIVPIIYLRAILQDKNPHLTYWGVLIPFTLITFTWSIKSLEYVDGEFAERISYLSLLMPWQDILSLGTELGSKLGNNNFLTAGKPYTSLPSESCVKLLVPSSLHMEESTTYDSVSSDTSKVSYEPYSASANKVSSTVNSNQPENININGMVAAVNLLAHLRSLNAHTEWCEKHNLHMLAFVQQVYDWCDDSEKGCISKQLADSLEKSADFLQDWTNKTLKARKVHDVAVGILKPAIDTNKGITETTYNSISKQGNNVLQDLEKMGKEYQKKDNIFEQCKKAYIKCKDDAIYSKVTQVLKDYWTSKKD